LLQFSRLRSERLQAIASSAKFMLDRKVIMRSQKMSRWGQIMVAATMLSSCVASAVEPQRLGQDNFVSRAVFASGRLWLLSDNGGLSSITPGKKMRVDAGLHKPALDICVSNGQIKALTCANKPCKEWTLRTWRDGRWSADAAIPSLGDNAAALNCAPGRDIVLTDRRLVEIVGGRATSVALSENLKTSAVTSLHPTVDHVFVGINAGEWGGGLRRIDRRTGKVTVIEKNSTGDLCGGPLNTSCDPVNGIADEPWRPGCVAIAIGVVHFRPRGRIVEVCKDEVRRLYFKALGDSSPRNNQRQGDEPFKTVAFFSLVRAGNELMAAGIDGVYRFDGSAEPKIIPLPKFEAIGQIRVSFDLPDVVLVLTAINQRRSMSGNIPLLVPR
jgi:hypothetical protein